MRILIKDLQLSFERGHQKTTFYIRFIYVLEERKSIEKEMKTVFIFMTLFVVLANCEATKASKSKFKKLSGHLAIL